MRRQQRSKASSALRSRVDESRLLDGLMAPVLDREQSEGLPRVKFAQTSASQQAEDEDGREDDGLVYEVQFNTNKFAEPGNQWTGNAPKTKEDALKEGERAAAMFDFWMLSRSKRPPSQHKDFGQPGGHTSGYRDSKSPPRASSAGPGGRRTQRKGTTNKGEAAMDKYWQLQYGDSCPYNEPLLAPVPNLGGGAEAARHPKSTKTVNVKPKRNRNNSPYLELPPGFGEVKHLIKDNDKHRGEAKSHANAAAALVSQASQESFKEQRWDLFNEVDKPVLLPAASFLPPHSMRTLAEAEGGSFVSLLGSESVERLGAFPTGPALGPDVSAGNNSTRPQTKEGRRPAATDRKGSPPRARSPSPERPWEPPSASKPAITVDRYNRWLVKSHKSPPKPEQVETLGILRWPEARQTGIGPWHNYLAPPKPSSAANMVRLPLSAYQEGLSTGLGPSAKKANAALGRPASAPLFASPAPKMGGRQSSLPQLQPAGGTNDDGEEEVVLSLRAALLLACGQHNAMFLTTNYAKPLAAASAYASNITTAAPSLDGGSQETLAVGGSVSTASSASPDRGGPQPTRPSSGPAAASSGRGRKQSPRKARGVKGAANKAAPASSAPLSKSAAAVPQQQSEESSSKKTVAASTAAESTQVSPRQQGARKAKQKKDRDRDREREGDREQKGAARAAAGDEEPSLTPAPASTPAPVSAQAPAPAPALAFSPVLASAPPSFIQTSIVAPATNTNTSASANNNNNVNENIASAIAAATAALSSPSSSSSSLPGQGQKFTPSASASHLHPVPAVTAAKPTPALSVPPDELLSRIDAALGPDYKRGEREKKEVAARLERIKAVQAQRDNLRQRLERIERSEHSKFSFGVDEGNGEEKSHRDSGRNEGAKEGQGRGEDERGQGQEQEQRGRSAERKQYSSSSSSSSAAPAAPAAAAATAAAGGPRSSDEAKEAPASHPTRPAFLLGLKDAKPLRRVRQNRDDDASSSDALAASAALAQAHASDEEREQRRQRAEEEERLKAEQRQLIWNSYSSSIASASVALEVETGRSLGRTLTELRVAYPWGRLLGRGKFSANYVAYCPPSRSMDPSSSSSEAPVKQVCLKIAQFQHNDPLMRTPSNVSSSSPSSSFSDGNNNNNNNNDNNNNIISSNNGSSGGISGGGARGIPVNNKTAPPPAVQEEFLREVRAMVACRHSCVVELLDVLVPPSPVGLVLELMVGGSLAAALAHPSWASVSQQQKMGILKGITRGLAKMHSLRFVHRDVKPHNVLLGPRVLPAILAAAAGLTRSASGTWQPVQPNSPRPDFESIGPEPSLEALERDGDVKLGWALDETGRQAETNESYMLPENWVVAKIGDLGTAVQVPEDIITDSGTVPGSVTGVYGTTGYIAPEVLREDSYSFAADVFSWSIVAHELFCEKPPAVNPLVGATAASFPAQRPALDGGHPALVRVVCQKAWQEQASSRPSSCVVLCGVFKVAVDDENEATTQT